MTLSLLRVDERLIHGQVVVGWGSELAPDHYVVIDEALAASEWEQDLYRLGLPDGVTVEFVGPEGAIGLLADWETDERAIIVLTRDLTVMAALGSAGGLDDHEVNVGGLHHAAGRREVLPYVHLDPASEGAVRELEARGVPVVARDLPAARAHRLEKLLDRS